SLRHRSSPDAPRVRLPIRRGLRPPVHPLPPTMTQSYRTGLRVPAVEPRPKLHVRTPKSGTLEWQRPEPSLWKGNRQVSDQRYDASETVAVATSASAVVARSPRVGYVPSRANLVRDGVAIALLVISLFLPWNLDFGLGIPGNDGSLFLVAVVVTLLAILAALTPH